MLKDVMPPFAMYINAGANFLEDVPELERLYLARRTAPERYDAAICRDELSAIDRITHQRDPRGPISYYDRGVPIFRYTMTNGEVIDGVEGRLSKERKRLKRKAQLMDPVLMAEETRQREVAKKAANTERDTQQRIARLEKELQGLRAPTQTAPRQPLPKPHTPPTHAEIQQRAQRVYQAAFNREADQAAPQPYDSMDQFGPGAHPEEQNGKRVAEAERDRFIRQMTKWKESP